MIVGFNSMAKLVLIRQIQERVYMFNMTRYIKNIANTITTMAFSSWSSVKTV